MGARDIAVDVLLALGVAGEVVCALGLLAGRAAIDRLHYAGAATTLPPALIAAAVTVEEGGTSAAINAIVVAALVLVLGSALTHATARVAHGRGSRR
jgi:multisubunit Na+/H+ antiporter MnhG subunit